MDTRSLRQWRNLTDVKDYMKKVHVQPKFDAPELVAKYKGVIWATDIHIQRLCLREIARRKKIVNGEKVDEWYDEVSSLPLP